jgi:hypothetical protein
VLKLAAPLAVLLGCALFVSAAQAAPPANDAFVSAQAIVGASGTVTGTNLEATKEPGEPNHAGNAGGRSVWYRWVAPFSGQAVFETCGFATFDTLVAVYLGPTVASLGVVAASDDDCREQSQAVFNAVAGTTYSIALDGFDGAAGGFTLRWGQLFPPPNDSFAGAQRLSGARGTVSGTTLGATREPSEPLHGARRPFGSVWYSWTAPITGGVGFNTCSGANFDTVLGVYTGAAVSSLTRLTANDDACRLFSRVRFAARRGTTYRIAVDGEGSLGERRGIFTLSWQAAVSPANDGFARARRIRGTRGSVAGSNLGATAERGERTHARSPAAGSMWYRWRAPRSMRILFETCGSRFDTVLAVYRGRSVRRVKALKANDDTCREGARVVLRVAARSEYRVVVDGYRGAAGSFRLRWRAR